MKLAYSSAALLAAALATTPATALAQGNEYVVPADELAEAKIIIDVMFPTDRREQIMLDIAKTMSNQIVAGMMTGPIFEEPGLRAIMEQFVADLPTAWRPLLAKHLPNIFESTAVAYTREFTLEELRDISAFAKTPSGERYFASLQGLLGDPAVAAANQAMLADLAPFQQEQSAKVRKQVEEYLIANPAVLERLAKAGVGQTS